MRRRFLQQFHVIARVLPKQSREIKRLLLDCFGSTLAMTSPRDQKTLKIGGIVLAILVFIRFIWWPLYSRVNHLRDEIAKEQNLITWMVPRVTEFMQVKESGKLQKQDKSLSGFEKSLQIAGLKPFVNEFTQNAQGLVSISFNAIPFESCMDWLEQIQGQGWVVQDLTAEKGDKQGMVQVRIVLL